MFGSWQSVSKSVFLFPLKLFVFNSSHLIIFTINQVSWSVVWLSLSFPYCCWWSVVRSMVWCHQLWLRDRQTVERLFCWQLSSEATVNWSICSYYWLLLYAIHLNTMNFKTQFTSICIKSLYIITHNWV